MENTKAGLYTVKQQTQGLHYMTVVVSRFETHCLLKLNHTRINIENHLENKYRHQFFQLFPCLVYLF